MTDVLTTGQRVDELWYFALERLRGHVGERVQYTSPLDSTVEYGHITVVGHKFVYVQYEGAPDPLATCPVNIAVIGDEKAHPSGLSGGTTFPRRVRAR